MPGPKSISMHIQSTWATDMAFLVATDAHVHTDITQNTVFCIRVSCETKP